MTDITGKTAFITGAASGIGLALAKRFTAAGANVMMADINADALAAAQKTVIGTTATVVCDVADPTSVKSAADATLAAFGAVHIIVNNAGVSTAGKPGNVPLSDWRWVMDINLMGVVHGVETFLPILRDQGTGGYFINTASMAGHLAAEGMGPYNASKFAVVGYSETLAQELAREKIGVSILCPAWVKTGIADAYKNRPSGFDADDTAQHMAVEAVANGINADVVADWTYDCMMARRLYIFTHPHFHTFLDQRKALLDADATAAAADPRFAKPTG
ncbi:SDR family NAD(P)-dependent oxidoreductase [Amylibacter sp. IMCC11727]|uniref:SDR family NAD(P)-dependent oxidoreductase n=1 Tax=Amylibacter sp. IMCC11727 TaxID=3039851 RepID=UPI00244DEA7A|nr:SDR family NAD(P)-dependent oxidoreductase [Amylibacter sp. IMCC11727]WGI22885.1 SDR family NAD(P)-dependent oxidoreductase [Amylibacter sp. IMCC11727]